MITLPGASSEPQAHICSASKADNEQIVSVGPLSADFVVKLVEPPEEQ
jgi:hypothetical protein